MKKLKLDGTNQNEGEFLSRNQLKNVLGGTVPMTGTNPYCEGTEPCGSGWKCADDRNSGLSDCDEATQWCIDQGTTGVRC